MPYSPERKCETRRKILESGRRLFNKKGFSEVSIDEVMKNAGLTHGGFYRHFRDKTDLYVEVIRWFLCPEAPKSWQRKSRDPAAEHKPRGQRVVDAYFSRDHFNDREGCCPLITQIADVARGSDEMKGAYREVLEKLVDIFQSDLADPEKHQRALAMVALCVGGMIVARCVDDPVLADNLRRAAHEQALQTAGWSSPPSDRRGAISR
jgi:AcrR family transcriptional regulator